MTTAFIRTHMQPWMVEWHVAACFVMHWGLLLMCFWSLRSRYRLRLVATLLQWVALFAGRHVADLPSLSMSVALSTGLTGVRRLTTWHCSYLLLSAGHAAIDRLPGKPAARTPDGFIDPAPHTIPTVSVCENKLSCKIQCKSSFCTSKIFWQHFPNDWEFLQKNLHAYCGLNWLHPVEWVGSNL